MENNALTDFLRQEPVCTLAVSIDGHTVHAAAMHYSISWNPFRLLFSSDRTQRKCLPLLSGDSAPASVVVGHSEERWVTCQMDGRVEIISDANIHEVKEIHYARVPSAREFEADPNTVFLQFIPTYIRLRDYNIDSPGILHSLG